MGLSWYKSYNQEYYIEVLILHAGEAHDMSRES